jgi:hypothetical protein
MDVLQQILNDVMASVPRLTLEKTILKKLQHQGVQFPKTLPRKLAEHILSGNQEPFQYRGRTQPKEISLSFDETDADEVTRAVEQFLNVQFPTLVDDFARRISRAFLKDLKRRWTEEQRLQQADLAGFHSRMEETWGQPLAKLRMLLTVAREWCGEAHQEIDETIPRGRLGSRN